MSYAITFPVLQFSKGGLTRGNKYECFSADIQQYLFTANTVNIWHSLPDHIIDVDAVKLV